MKDAFECQVDITPKLHQWHIKYDIMLIWQLDKKSLYVTLCHKDTKKYVCTCLQSLLS